MNVESNIKFLQEFLNKQELDWAYVSAHDHFLNEYVSTQDRLRFYFSNFTGSAGEMLIPKKGKAILITDGRYTEQAEKEVDQNLIEVHTISVSESIEDWMEKHLEAKGAQAVGVFAHRTKASFALSLEKKFKLYPLDEMTILKEIDYVHVDKEGSFYHLKADLSGEEVESKVKRILSKYQTVFFSNLESVSWVTNLRGYQFPFQSAVRGKVLIQDQSIFFFSNEKTLESLRSLNLPEIIKLKEEKSFQTLLKEINPQQVSFDFSMINFSDFKTLEESVERTNLNHEDFVSQYNAKKNPVEIEVFADSFDRSDKAIFKTFKWLRENASQREISEYDFKTYLEDQYRDQGAISQSFNTISGFGSNGSIIHYGKASKDKIIKSGELALLDSGAYYKGGLATDCTRTMVGFGEADNEVKLWYTLVLKSLLSLLNAEFKPGTPGEELDQLARKPLKEHGLDFAHGTGHGIGINVHEKGYSIRPNSKVPLTEGLVGSLEPGFYAPGVGGIRLENIALIEKHPQKQDMLHFRNLVFIGFDQKLINKELLSETEISWLANYESECDKRARSF